MTRPFVEAEADLIYLDGNSLGRLPAATPGVLHELVIGQWGARLVDAWEEWIDWPSRIGDELGHELLGAPEGSVLVCDSTTVNFYKLAAAALEARPGRDVIVTDRDNFPTDRYVLEGLAAQRGARIRWLECDPIEGPRPHEVAAALDSSTALLTLSHVAYRSAAIADMRAISRAARDAGALSLWDLSHSVGALPIELGASGADLAVGCTYKYLNAGPGSPAFLYVRPGLQGHLRPPIWGWFSQRDQFDMQAPYRPLAGIGGFAAGTPPVLGLAAVRSGLRSLADVGIEALRARSIELTGRLVAEADEHLSGLGFGLGSPSEAERRGGHVLLTHREARRISVALRALEKVVGDFRPPDGLRLAPVPAYVSAEQVSEAVRRIARLVAAGRHLSLEAPPARVS